MPSFLTLVGTLRHIVWPHQPEVGSFLCREGRGEDGVQAVLEEQHDLLPAHLRLSHPPQTDFFQQTEPAMEAELNQRMRAERIAREAKAVVDPHQLLLA